jgi:opacity protein-like surface antigen
MTHVSAKKVSAKFGIYDFTDDITRDFYQIAPMFLLSYDVLEISYVKVSLSAGASYNTVKYNSKRHFVEMYPAFISVTYDLPSWNTRLYPFFGGGLSAILKKDKNEWMPSAHRNFTYGYHVIFGVYRPIAKRWSLGINFQYNMFNAPNVESIDMSGALPTLELRYNFNKLLKLE